MARVLPVVGDVVLEVLRERELIGRVARVAEIPVVHAAAVPVGERARVLVAQVARQLHRRAPDGDRPRRGLRHLRAFGAGEAAEVVVEGVVLLDDDDDVLDGELAAGRRIGRRRRDAAATAAAATAAAAGAAAAAAAAAGRAAVAADATRARATCDEQPTDATNGDNEPGGQRASWSLRATVARRCAPPSFSQRSCCCSAGCGEDPTTSSDLSVGPPDLAAPCR